MKIGWRIFIIVTACATGLYLSRKPWSVFQEQRGKTNLSVQEMKAAEQERTRLLQQKTRLDSPIGKEEAVRDMGFQKVGEAPVEPK